jgi:hypothetical protein
MEKYCVKYRFLFYGLGIENKKAQELKYGFVRVANFEAFLKYLKSILI